MEIFFLVALLPCVFAQLDYLATICNPLMKICSADPALGGVVSTDFTQGEDIYWTVYSGPPLSYGIEGATFTATPNNSRTVMASISYVMFGRVEAAIQRSLGTGIVASLNFQSDAGDNLSFTWHGIEKIARLNWSGLSRSVTGRETNVSDGTMDFNTYAIDWTPERIQWMINGAVVQNVTPADVPINARYPQTPASIKIGIWNSGDYADPTTAQWGGGPVNWSSGPYNMSVRSINLTDYSTGQAYSYSDRSGGLESIVSLGGSINGSTNSTSPTNTATTPTILPSLSSTAAPENPSWSLSIAENAGIGAGAGVLGLALLLSIVAIWKRRQLIRAAKIGHHQKDVGLLVLQDIGVASD